MSVGRGANTLLQNESTVNMETSETTKKAARPTPIQGAKRAAQIYFVGAILGQHRTIPALRLKHRSCSCGTASALPKCSIMSGCGTRIVLRGQKPLALCDRCPCFGSLFPPLAALTFAASSLICAFGLASAAPRSPYRHLEFMRYCPNFFASSLPRRGRVTAPCRLFHHQQHIINYST